MQIRDWVKHLTMKPLLIILFLTVHTITGCTQKTASVQKSGDIVVGGRCEGCEAIFECPVPFESLKSIDTLPGFNQAGQKIAISSTVFHRDGKTPAKDVIIYLYHTDQNGLYPKKGDEKGWARRHGYIRGWLKTDENGFYKFFTLLPASYPDSRNPKHIHITVKEQGKTAYWLEDFLIEGDPYLEKPSSPRKPGGGNGVVKLTDAACLLKAERNLVLGLNVEDYPENR